MAARLGRAAQRVLPPQGSRHALTGELFSRFRWHRRSCSSRSLKTFTSACSEATSRRVTFRRGLAGPLFSSRPSTRSRASTGASARSSSTSLETQGQKSHQMKQVFVTLPQRSVADESWLRDKLPITKGSLSRSHEPSVTALPLNARRSQAKLRCCPDPVIGAHAQKGYRHSCHRRCHQRCRPHVDCLAAAERAASDSVGRVRRLQRSPDYD